MSTVRVKVPATTANIGPGFDCLGIAFRIYNWVTISRGEGGVMEGIFAEAADAFFKKTEEASFPFLWKITGQVPRSRGLGSSVTVRLGVLHGLNALVGAPLKHEEIFEMCAELEGHPDNAAPAAFGGFTIARPDRPVQRFKVDRRAEFVLVIPDFEVATPEARRVLPKQIPFSDAVISAANASAIAAALATRNYEALAGCFEDRLHQPYRRELVPMLPGVIEAGVKAGALGGWLSGSGSTMACLTLKNSAEVAEAMRAASGNAGAKVVITQADNTGVRVYRRD